MKMYVTYQDLKEIIPNLTDDNARKLINEARDEMKKRNYLIPIARPKVALTSIIYEKLGIERS